MRLFRVLAGVLLVASLAGQAPAQQQKPVRKPASAKPGSGVTMHKCIDAAGKVYYSDKLTPECARSSELNRQGVTLDRKSSGDSAGQAGAPKKEAKTPAQSVAQARRDKALLATYTSEKEIDLARDRNLEMPSQAVRTIEARRGKTDKELQDLMKRADGFAAGNKPVPAHLAEEISKKRSALTALDSELAQKNAQTDRIRANFEADKQRFRELKDSASR